MSHGLTIKNGFASMMYYGNEPWHGLGTKLDSPATSKEAIKAANLDWNVIKIDLYGKTRNFVNVNNFKATIIDKDVNCENPRILGVVSKNYKPVQNAEAFEFFDSIVGGKKAIYHTAGSLNNDRIIWILAKLPGEIRVIGDDITDKYLLLCNSHDGSSSVKIKFTPVRVVCQNTLTLALGDVNTIKIKHTGNVIEQLEQAKRTLGIIDKGFTLIKQAFKDMAETKITKRELHKYLFAVYPDVKDEIKTCQNRKNRAIVERFYEEGNGTDIKGVQGTVWGAYNAVTEFVDHKRNNLNPGKQLYNIWFGSAGETKQKAFRLAGKKELWLN